ncbi:MAG: class I SAM-dependent methyltransferase [Bacteroidales bacterium]|jgi:ubiquinone/menaquinone biosynthesis C-methylase UbiE|nr:class I SAM-dependent methyltransferase [Bacteroidales bacterium]
MTNSTVEKIWDYSQHAKHYCYRPNYSDKAIDLLVAYIGSYFPKKLLVADIGAGTGNLTIKLIERGCGVDAVEPNDEMRKIGIEATKSAKVSWIKATGTETTLDTGKYDWVTYGSSFNVIDRELGLKESYRLLQSKGFFTCMWNHRMLSCPIQMKVEKIISKHIPQYARGVRREDQRPFLEKYTSLFKDIFYLEVDFCVPRTIDEYVSAWKSVKNKYWDLGTPKGKILFDKIFDEVKTILPKKFCITYTTKAWTVQKSK